MSDDYVLGTLIPTSFLPDIGMVTVLHARVDQEMNRVIWRLAGVTEAVGRIITSNINSTTTRVTLLRQMAEATVEDPTDLAKLQKLATAMDEATNEWNRLHHDEQLFHSPADESIGFIRSNHQIKPRPPTHFTKGPKTVSRKETKSLHDLSMTLFRLLGRFQQYIIKSPRWQDDIAEFP